MTRNEIVQVGSVVESDGKRYIVYDYCKPCQTVWMQRPGNKIDKPETKKKKYSEVKLLLY